MTLLRVLTVVAWAMVLVVMAPAVWSALIGRARQEDPYRLAFFGFAAVAIGFSARQLFVPESHELWAALYVLSIMVALYVLHAGRSYGRGPHV